MIAQIIKKIMAKEVRYSENQKQWFGRNLQNRGYNINNQIDHLGGIHKGYPIFWYFSLPNNSAANLIKF